MTLAQLLTDYLDKKVTAIYVIRTMSGMFNPDQAVHILAVINQITRLEEGDLDAETFKSILGLK